MTRQEQIELSDSILAIRAILERADHLMQSLLEDYFNKYDPDNNKGAFAIQYSFPKMRAFASLLQDQLTAIESELPTTEWVDGLKCEGGAEE